MVSNNYAVTTLERPAARAEAGRQIVARERARKIASKNRSSTTTGIGGSFQLANSAPPLGVTGSASAPTARMGGRGRRDTPAKAELRGKAGQDHPARGYAVRTSGRCGLPTRCPDPRIGISRSEEAGSVPRFGTSGTSGTAGAELRPTQAAVPGHRLVATEGNRDCVMD